MNIRVKYTKMGDIIFIPHLDMVRLIHRTAARANFKISHSQGFSPHPRTSFSPALPLGVESNCEYVDIQTEEDVDLEKLITDLNRVSVEGVEFLQGKVIEEKATSLMAFLTHFSYEMKFFDCDFELIKEFFENLKNTDYIEYSRVTKSEKTVYFNLKEYIQKIEFKEENDYFISYILDLESSSQKSLNLRTFIAYINEQIKNEDMYIHSTKIDAYKLLENNTIIRPMD